MSNTHAYTDVAELCAIMQCLGFTVKSFDAGDNVNKNLSQDGVSKTVIINCQVSGMHVVLESANTSCSCPAQTEQNSGVWEVSGIAGGKQLDKEFGSTLLGSLPKARREWLTKELREMITYIKDNNESADVEKLAKEDNKSASMAELKTPEEKLLFVVKAETSTRYRSLDTLTAGKELDQQIPTPGLLQRARFISDCEGTDEKKMCRRQSTYTLSSTPGSVRRRNKTSSPIEAAVRAPSNNVLESLRAAERSAADLHSKLAYILQEYPMLEDKNDSSMSSLALDVSKISVLKPDTPKAQFASSPNLPGISAHDDMNKKLIKRYESSSTSKLAVHKESKMSRIKRLSPNIFKKKETLTLKSDSVKSQDGGRSSKLNSIFKPKLIAPVHTSVAERSQSINSSSKNKYSHIKSTIPRLAKKD